MIHLTQQGLDWRDVAKKAVLDFNEHVFSHFNKDEISNFFKILKKINKIIDNKK